MGASVLAVVVGAVNDALDLVQTSRRASIISGVLILVWFVSEIAIWRFRPIWRVADANVRVNTLGSQPRLAFVGAILFLWIAPLLNYFTTPEEVAFLPHLQYEYSSNYPDKYLRLRQSNHLENPLKFIVNVRNRSKYNLENIRLKTYIYCDNAGFRRFVRPYYLNTAHYLLIGELNPAKLEPDEILTLDLIKVIRVLTRSEDELNKLLLPIPGEFQDLPQLPRFCKHSKAADIFTDAETLLEKEYEHLNPSNAGQSHREPPFGFKGAMLKILIEYEINEMIFKHLLVGGMYYKYVVAGGFPFPETQIPTGAAVSGFFKAPFTLWKRKDQQAFSSIEIRQHVVNSIEESQFRSYVSGPVQPGQELSVRVDPEKDFPNQRYFPVPIYLYVQNNVKTAQPDNLKGLTLQHKFIRPRSPYPK
jgi:hypothetical protein